MADYFIDREDEVRAFEEALDKLIKGEGEPSALVYHGASGMGKTYVIRRCREAAESHTCKPFVFHVDCNRANMTLEGLFNDIHTQLETTRKKLYDEYIEFLDEVEDIEDELEKNISADTETSGKLSGVVSAVAGKAVATAVPGAAMLGEENIGKVAGFATDRIGEGISAIRKKIAKRKLSREKYRYFLKDLQKERAEKLAEILNKSTDEGDKLVLFIDRFEQFAKTPNTISDITYYVYFRDHFVNKLSKNVLVVIGGRLEIGDDLVTRLDNRRVHHFSLNPFTEGDIDKIPEIFFREKHIRKRRAFVRFVHEKTRGYPVVMGLLEASLRSAMNADRIEETAMQIMGKEGQIVENAVNWLLDENLNKEHRDVVFRLTICCSRTGRIDRDAVCFVYDQADMRFADVEEMVRILASRFSFINARDWTIHEIAREFILRYINRKDAKYVQDVSRQLQAFYMKRAESENVEVAGG